MYENYLREVQARSSVMRYEYLCAAAFDGENGAAVGRR